MRTPKWFHCAVALIATALLVGCGRQAESDSGGGETRSARDEVAGAQDKLPKSSDPALQTELTKLEGQWAGVSFHMDGLQVPVSQWYRYSFDGDRMTTETSLAGPATVRFYLDSRTEPMRLDTAITVDGVEEVTKGIYSLEGDVLRLSWRVAGDRPTDFHPRDRDEKIVLVLRREDAGDRRDEPRAAAKWPFRDPENVAVITLSSILNGSRPILYVVHDEDGDWQFLDGHEVSEDEAAVASLKRIVQLDASLKSLADLPIGWAAERRSPDQPWQRFPQ